MAGCGQEDSSGVAQEPTSQVPTPSTSPDETPIETPTTYEPPELGRTELDANLAALSPEDRSLVDHYVDGNGDEGLDVGTWIVAAPLTVAEARDRLLGPGA